jgi:hypothetical protein
VISSVPEMREEKDRLAKERDKLERELERQRRMARELQDQVPIWSTVTLHSGSESMTGSFIFWLLQVLI